MTDIKPVLAELRLDACRANVELARRGLARFTFGNASAISREHGLVAIKPSGVAYDRLEPDDLIVVDLDGQVIDGTLRPSSWAAPSSPEVPR